MKLLTRTIRNYVVFSALLFAFCTPAFYFAIHNLFIHEMDKVLIEHKKDFERSIYHLRSESDLVYYHLMNKEFTLIPGKVISKTDSLLSLDIYDSAANKNVPFRQLRTSVLIQGKPYQLHIQESMVSTTDLIAAIVSIQIGLLIVLFIGLVLINRKLSRKIWDPFYRTLNRLKQYQIDKDASLDLPHSSTAEFRDLSTTISQLIVKNHNAYQSQKEFTENASHEMQTPLAIVNGKLDLLMQTDLTEYQADLISIIQDSTLRLSRLNRNLLLLAKIENNQFQNSEIIDLTEIIDTQLKQFDDLRKQKELAFNRQLESFPIWREVNKALFEILLSNLLSNAIRYAPQNSTITISLTKSGFTISNAGNELKNPDTIFDRFQREDKNSSGIGIGLAIVKKICDNLGHIIQYSYRNGLHHFEIKFA